MLNEKRQLEIEEHLRTAAAYHEAGHAVMFMAVEPSRNAFRYVGLTPYDEDTGGLCSHISLRHLYPDWKSDAATAFRIFSHEFCTIIAGPIVDIKYGEISGSGDVSDWDDLDDFYSQSGTDGDKLFLYDAGLTTITGEKAQPWHHLELLTREFLETHWGHVDRVAKAILEKGTLDFDATVAAMGDMPTLPPGNWIDRQRKRLGRKYDFRWPMLCHLIGRGPNVPLYDAP